VRLPETAHTSRPWRIHEVTRDFRVEDVWRLPGTAEREEFPALVALLTSLDPASSSSRAVRALFAVRWKVGELLGWDGDKTGVVSPRPTLLDRLPPDLRDVPRPAFSELPATSLYLLDDEWAAEVANETMHGVIHVGLIPEGPGRYGAQMAILVKPNGLLGEAYMAAIKPFRYAIVYPRLMSELGRQWRERPRAPTPAHA
jgi:hypothetical protein